MNLAFSLISLLEGYIIGVVPATKLVVAFALETIVKIPAIVGLHQPFIGNVFVNGAELGSDIT